MAGRIPGEGDRRIEFRLAVLFLQQRREEARHNPEYGGDGKKTDRCGAFTPPVVGVPRTLGAERRAVLHRHAVPEPYQGGAFVAFHGSWNRAPLPQGGYNVTFVPFAGGKPGKYEVFADGFAAKANFTNPNDAAARPGGVAVGPDGSLYVTVPELLAPDGTDVNAVRGMVGYLAYLVEQYRPTHLVCCWDEDWRPEWRVDLIPTYKSHRVVEPVAGAPDIEEVPDPLEVQVPIIREVLEAFGIAVVGAPGYEADDVIGTLVASEVARRTPPVDVITGDRDLFQLVDDTARVRVLYTGRASGPRPSTRRWSSRSTPSGARRTPTWPPCAATRATACRG